MDFYHEWLRQLRDVEAKVPGNEVKTAIAQENIAARLLGKPKVKVGEADVMTILKVTQREARIGLRDLKAAAPELFA
jgi:hypothetical protein